MKHRRKLLLVGVLVVGAVLLLWWWTQPAQKTVPPQAARISSPPAQAKAIASTSVSTQDQKERRKTTVENILNVLGTSISFYGKVIDQNGDPVPDANVQYGAIDKFDADGSRYEGKSDANGLFSISGIKGAVLTVGVWKEGYYNINDKSDGAFAYGAGVDPTRKEPPKKDKPAVFILQKMGVAEPLIQVSSRQIDVPRTGQPIRVDFANGQTGRGGLQIASWIGDSNKRPFDWRYELSVPGGGLVERKGQFDFEAPDQGYQPSIEVKMAADAKQWTSRLAKEYFAKLGDGKYARFSVRFYAGDRSFVVLESYLNPAPGSRNLEFDPKKVVKSP